MNRIDAKTTPRTIFAAGILVIVIACFLAYIPAMKAGFIWDDDQYVTDNSLLTSPGGLYRIWTSGTVTSQFFPLTYTTFWLEYRLWDFNPMGYHVVNVAIHIINSLLLWLVLRRLSIPGSWLAAAVFALHPVQVESVAWVTERKNLLMLLFSLLSVLCWLEFALASKSGRRAILFYLGSLALYALALFGKATASTLPAAMVLILWLKRVPLTAKRLLQLVPFVVMGIGMGLLVMWWEKHHQGTGDINLGLSFPAKLLIAGRAFWFYLWKLFWPANLIFSYPRWNIDPAEIWQYVWPAASVLLIFCSLLWHKRLGRATATAILFFTAMLFPMLGFFSLFTFIYTFVADHYQYVACIGPVALVAAGGVRLWGRPGTKLRVIIISTAGVLLITLGALTWRQCRIYKNTETLWRDTLNKNPDSLLAQGQIVKLLFEQDKFIEAKPYLERSIELAQYVRTIDSRVYASLYYNLGIILEKQNRFSDAADSYQKALDSTDYFKIVTQANFRLARVLAYQGKDELARIHFLRALELAKANKNNDLAEESFQWLVTLENKRKHPGN